MGFFARISFAIIVIIVSCTKVRKLTKPLPVPKLDLDAYWGPGEKENYKADMKVTPAKISYPKETIERLRKHLNESLEFHEPLEGIGFEYGFNTNYLPRLIKYWRDEYLPNWSARETYLQKWPQFTTSIQGLRIHFIYVRPDGPPKGKKVFPLLLLHGWPGSIREFHEFIAYLVNNADSEYEFEIIVPCLPGYGWSQGASKPGMGIAEIAVILRNLMLRLGHQKFFVQGGDWGSLIGSNIATLFPENVLGYHSNMCVVVPKLNSLLKNVVASYFPTYFAPKEFEDLFFPVLEKIKFVVEESGYIHIQATKPDTIGTALSNNPIGLAAYILEKFSTATNADYRKLADGGLEKKFTLEKLLDNIMIYYLTNSMTTAVRLYAESLDLQAMSLQLEQVPTNVPTGCARFKHDIRHDIDWVLKDKFLNLIHSTYYEDGGHFAALEIPKVLYDDLIVFIEKVIKLNNL